MLRSRHWRVEDRALWHEAKLDVTPEGNRQLACNGDDHDFPHTLALTRSVAAYSRSSGAQTIGKQRPFSGAQGGKVDPCAPQPWFDAANALSNNSPL